MNKVPRKFPPFRVFQNLSEELGEDKGNRKEGIKKEMEEISPRKMGNPFTSNEIRKAVKALKNGKSPGADEINAEMLKFCSTLVYDIIAEVLNERAETENYPD